MMGPPDGLHLSVAEALVRLRERTAPAPLAMESVPIAAAAGRILGSDVAGVAPSPPFDAVAVDGWAFRHADLVAAPEGLHIRAGRAAAGHPFAYRLAAGEAVRVLTGAALPPGADSVAPDEICTATGGRLRVVRELAPFANRRTAGEDARAGERVLEAGRVLRPSDLGLAAQLGLTALPVRRRLRVALASSGDELRDPGTDLGPGAIYDANRTILAALLERNGFAVVDLGILADDAATVVQRLRHAAAEHDAVVVSGGVSLSEEDHVGRAIQAHGRLDLWHLRMKPGRPLALGRLDGALVVGLPGNPVAATVAFLRFARPVLLRLAGALWPEPVVLQLPAAFARAKRAGRTEYLRGRLVAGPAVMPVAKQGSAMLTSLAAASGLIELDEACREVVPGDPVGWLSFNDLGAA